MENLTYRPIDLTQIFYEVRDSHENIELETGARLFSQIFNSFIFKDYQKQEGKYALQVVLLILLSNNHEMTIEKYQIYLKVMEYLGIKPASLEEINNVLKDSLIEKNINAILNFFFEKRMILDSNPSTKEIYRHFIAGLVIIVTFDSGEILKHQYDLITCFLDESYKDKFLFFDAFIETLKKDE